MCIWAQRFDMGPSAQFEHFRRIADLYSIGNSLEVFKLLYYDCIFDNIRFVH